VKSDLFMEEKMTASHILAIIANIIIFAVYAIYLKQVIKGQSTPNPATWTIWFSVLLINSITYIIITENIYKSFISISACIFVGIILVFSYFKGALKALETVDKCALIGVLPIVIFWQISENAEFSNLALQAILLISFIPTIKRLLDGTLKEASILPWSLAVIAYGFQIAVVLVNFNGNYYAIAFPIVNGILGNGSVAVIIVYVNKKRT